MFTKRETLRSAMFLAVISIAAVARPAQAQAPASGVDPISLKLMDLTPITQLCLPAYLDGEINQTIAGQSLMDRTQTLGLPAVPEIGFPGFDAIRIRVRSSLGSTSIRIPIDEDAIQAAFLNGTTTAGRVRAEFDFPSAELHTSLRFRADFAAGFTLPFPINVFQWWIEDQLVFDATFFIRVQGMSGHLQALVNRVNNRVSLGTIEQAQLRVGPVTMVDTAGFSSFMNAVDVTVAQVFNQPQGSTLTTCLTRVTNAALATNLLWRNRIRDAVNAGLNGGVQIPPYSQELPCTDAIRLNVAASLATLSTVGNGNGSGVLSTSWNVVPTLATAAVNTTLRYTYQARPLTVWMPNIACDLDTFVPWSLFDKVGFEAARGGLFNRTVAMPHLAGATLVMVPTGTPRAAAVAGQPNTMRWSVPISIRKQSGPTSFSASLTATMQIEATLALDDRSGLRATVSNVQIVNAAGTIRVAGIIVPIDTIVSQIAPTLSNAVRAAAPHYTIVPRFRGLIPGADVALQTLQMGGNAVRVSLVIAEPE
ncbi:MAG: hypothetical protein AB7Q17_17275 [Phycisphaerae bacterium]